MKRRTQRTQMAALFAGAILAACASAPSAPLDPALDGLPSGEARSLLANVCTTCHDLGGLQAYKGYYGAEQWRDMVATMIDHGAELEPDEADAVVAYLTEHFGPDTR